MGESAIASEPNEPAIIKLTLDDYQKLLNMLSFSYPTFRN
ncbi:hypothetical protein NUACC26_015430 [Scytonema sp. NUACC26]